MSTKPACVDWSENGLVREHLERACDAAAADHRRSVHEFAHHMVSSGQEFDGQLESPLEAVMCVWMVCLLKVGGASNFMIQRQVEIVTSGQLYRADFMVGWRQPRAGSEGLKPVIVEVDGHAFHEKAKEQVQRRNQRDRDLQNDGYVVLHFSFSEVTQHPEWCIGEIAMTVTRRFCGAF